MSIERAQVTIVSNSDGSNIEAESTPNKKPKLSTSVVANSATDDDGGAGTSLNGAQVIFPGTAATDEILEYCTTHSYS